MDKQNLLDRIAGRLPYELLSAEDLEAARDLERLGLVILADRGRSKGLHTRGQALGVFVIGLRRHRIPQVADGDLA